MTYAPASLKALGAYLTAHDAVNLGIVGDTAHQAKGTSYHLGADLLSPTAYSRQTARDKAGLTNAASAIDVGKIDNSYTRLRAFSVWLVGRSQANDLGTSDIREVIYSPDGHTVLRWDRERGYGSAPQPGEADNSHLTHTHISYYRDSEARDKVALVSRFFGSAASGDDVIDPAKDLPVATATVAPGGTLYADPERKTVLVKSWVGGTNIGVYAQRGPLTAIRIDTLSGPAEHLIVAWIGTDKVTLTTANTDAAFLAGRQKQWDLDHQFAVVTLPARPAS